PDVANAVDAEMIQIAGRVIGLEFTASEAELMTYAVNLNYANFEAIRQYDLGNAALPAFHFNPRLPSYHGPRALPMAGREAIQVTRPQCLEELAFYPVSSLGELVRTRQVTSVELTEMYLDRLKNYGPQLACVATLTEELALRQAARADAEIAAGHYR